MPAGTQSAFDPQGPGAAAIAELTWVLALGSAVVFVLVMVLTGLAVWRRPRWLGSQRLVLAGGLVFPLVVLSLLLVYSLARMGNVASASAPSLRIELVAHQWWWRVRYLDPSGQVDFETANEIRIPAKANIEVALRSADVLHSVWIPALAGKLDMIPGKDNRLRFSAERTGVFRGQCAEYCGGPHALMALYVIALTSDDFEAWRTGQRRPATADHELFQSRCAACHTVRGTAARGELGPDLTHVGSRVSLAAGILPNTSHALAEWIAFSQRIKPGNLMPAFGHFSSEELRGLANYLGNLK